MTQPPAVKRSHRAKARQIPKWDADQDRFWQEQLRQVDPDDIHSVRAIMHCWADDLKCHAVLVNPKVPDEF